MRNLRRTPGYARIREIGIPATRVSHNRNAIPGHSSVVGIFYLSYSRRNAVARWKTILRYYECQRQ
jgi:hypothetical protein